MGNFTAQDCDIIAELIVEVAPPVMCTVGISFRDFKACSTWLWLNANPDFKEALKKATELGCELVVETGPTYYKVIVYDSKKGISRLKQTYRSLNTYHGMEWLRRYLSGYY